MLGRILGVYFGVTNPKARLFMNAFLGLFIISFAYYDHYDTLEFNMEYDFGVIDEEALLMSRIKAAVGFYGVYLLFLIWQIKKWTKKRNVHTNHSVEKEQHIVKKEVATQIKKEEKVDPNRASFKMKRLSLIEKYIRS